jgi:PAS domain-containing protein
MSNVTGAHDTLFQLSGVGVVETDMTTGCFMRANSVFCRMVGYREDELLEGVMNFWL